MSSVGEINVAIVYIGGGEQFLEQVPQAPARELFARTRFRTSQPEPQSHVEESHQERDGRGGMESHVGTYRGPRSRDARPQADASCEFADMFGFLAACFGRPASVGRKKERSSAALLEGSVLSAGKIEGRVDNRHRTVVAFLGAQFHQPEVVGEIKAGNQVRTAPSQ